VGQSKSSKEVRYPSKHSRGQGKSTVALVISQRVGKKINFFNSRLSIKENIEIDSLTLTIEKFEFL